MEWEDGVIEAILVGLNLLSVDIECGDILLLMVYDIRGRDLSRDKRLHRFIGGLGAPCQLSQDQFPTLKVWHSREWETTEMGVFAALVTHEASMMRLDAFTIVFDGTHGYQRHNISCLPREFINLARGSHNPNLAPIIKGAQQ